MADGVLSSGRFWHQGLQRELLRSGEAARLIEQGIVGFSTDLASLERAIGEGSAYDEAMNEAANVEMQTALERMMIEDGQQAADLLAPLYERTGQEGFVSLDLPPAESPEHLLDVARRWFRMINRRNVMLKIPGLAAYQTVIEEALFAGINVHVTHLYSAQQAMSIAEGYVRALERRLYGGLEVDRLASVVGFGLDSLNQMVENSLRNSIRAAQSRGDLTRVAALNQLVGKACLANAHTTHARLHRWFAGERFARLRQVGAKVQRLLWEELTPRNSPPFPAYFLESLALPDARCLADVYALPVMRTDAAVPEAEQAATTLERLREVGVDLEQMARQLQTDHEEMRAEAYRRVLARIDGKRKLLVSGFMRRQKLVLGQYQGPVEAELKRLRQQKTISRTWQRDARLWKDSPDQIALIENRLGWLTIASDGRVDRARLRALRDEARAFGWRHIVLLGMGSSVNAIDALAKTFGAQPGYAKLLTLDSTDPAVVRGVESQIDPDKTLFVVASKTGTTLETISLLRYFYPKIGRGDRFIAVTDTGSKLQKLADDLGFRHIFENPEDVGGSFGALSYAGMVPAALLGLDFERLMDAGHEMQLACGSNVMGVNHPGLWLGTVLGVLARRGLDKLTLFTSPEIAPLATWIEQLVAEGLGKDGKGIIPVVGATLGMPHDYDDDRLFVYLRLDQSANSPDDAARMFQEAGHPVVTLELRDLFDLGGEFFRWQFATAIAGAILGVNPFDEPDVTESKQNTARLLHTWQQSGHWPYNPPVMREDGLSLYADESMANLLQNLSAQHAYNTTALNGLLAAFLSMARSGDYVALLAYLPETPDVCEALENVRRRLRHTFNRAVALCVGPRYLHTVGQLHKGGPDKGVFVLLTADDSADLPIPDAPYSFGVLRQAQAAGDFETLQARGRRVARLHTGADPLPALNALLAAIEAAAEKRK